MSVKVCFLGSARYRQPLDPTSQKKFQLLTRLGDIFVVGFHRRPSPCAFTEHASFYLLPEMPMAILRYAEMFVLGPLLAGWLIFRHRVQILVAQGPYEGVAAAVAKKIALAFGAKVVLIVESHGDFQESLFLQRGVLVPRIYRSLMRRAAHFALRHADLLRAISETTRQQLEGLIADRPIVLFPTWTDIETFFEVAHGRKVLDEQNVLYAGVLTPLKGVHHLVRAFASIAPDMPRARLILIGREENPTYSAALKHLTRQLGLEARVQFIGEVSQSKLATWMAKAYVFVLPSVSEGLGRVVIEAMATGTPVIASDVGGIRETVEDGMTGFRVPPGDEKALADRLRWMFAHPSQAKDMGSRGQSIAKRLFSAERCLQGYGQLFEMARRVRDRGRATSAL